MHENFLTRKFPDLRYTALQYYSGYIEEKSCKLALTYFNIHSSILQATKSSVHGFIFHSFSCCTFIIHFMFSSVVIKLPMIGFVTGLCSRLCYWPMEEKLRPLGTKAHTYNFIMKNCLVQRKHYNYHSSLKCLNNVRYN